MTYSLLCAFLAPVLVAQQPGAEPSAVFHDAGATPATPTSSVSAVGNAMPMLLNRTAGLQLLDGELWGGADGYKVRFDADGFEFTPALGPAVPRNYPMQFRLQSIGRGSELVPLAAPKQRHDGLRVEYDRGSVIERYDLGPEAMEQSFVFTTRPRGQGDLVVRGRMRTDMQTTHERDGLRVEQPGFGGFHVGAVTGVDANGARAQGSVRYDDGIVELSLPAEFVDHAVFPLVLDPLIGIAFGLNLITGFDDRGPLAAFDTSNDCYLVIWSNVFSATDVDVNGQRISRAGSLLGTRVFIETSTALETEPTICNVNGRNTFVVAYNRNGDILARGITAANGAVSLAITVAGGTSNQHSPSIGGDPVAPAVNIPGNSVCVWESDAEPAVLATRVILNTDGTLSLSGTVHTLASGSTGRPSRPRISKSGGTTGRYAVAFERLFADRDPWAIVINSSGAPITAAIAVDSATGHDEKPEVDGDGTNWVVAWQHEVSTTGPNFHDAFARSIAIAGSPAALIATPIVQLMINIPALNDELTPSVIRTGGSTLVGVDYRALPLFGDSSSVASLDPFDCALCEGVIYPHINGAVAEGAPFGCSALSGGGPPDDALLVWEFITASNPANADIAAQFWHSADGAVSSLGGGCGSGGIAQATCVRVPNPAFAHRLRGATPSAGTLLLQSLGQESGVCGPCTRVPALNGIVTLFLLTDSVGNAALRSVIPNNSALRGLVQLTLRSGGACIQFDIDMSNALRIVIE